MALTRMIPFMHGKVEKRSSSLSQYVLFVSLLQNFHTLMTVINNYMIVFVFVYPMVRALLALNRRMAENGFAPPPPLGNFANISYLVEN